MALSRIHADLSWVVVVANGVVGVWALVAHRDARFRTRHLWPATVVAQLMVFAQVALGVALVAVEEREVAQMHAFYGFVAIAAVGIIYSYRHQMAAHLHLLYGLGGLFVMGLAIRAMTLSPFPSP